MVASVFLSRVIGLFREMVIAPVGGATGAVDAYQVAFVIPEILNHIVASGFLSVTFIPIFSRYLATGEEDRAWEVFSIVLTCFGTLLLVFISFSIIFASQLVGLIAPGLSDPVLIAKAVRMTRIILPAQFFFFVGGLLMAVQFSKERFFIPALAPLIYNLGIIGGGLLLGPWLGMEGFAWGVLAGAFCGNLAVQLQGARKVGMRFAPLFNFSHPDLKKYILLTLPLMVGLTMTFSTEFFFRFFGSFLPQGSIAVLNFGLRIMLMLVGIFGQAVGTASFPYMARLVAENKLVEMNRLLTTTLRYLALVIPFSVFLMVIRSEVVLILFQRGRFDSVASNLTSQALLFFLIGAFAFSAYTVVVRAYFAIQNTLFPAIYGSIAVLLSIPLYLLGMQRFGISGIALAVSISGILQVAFLYRFWNKRSNYPGGNTVYFFYLKIILFSIGLGFLLALFKGTLLSGIDTSTFAGSLVVSFLVGCLFGGILLLAGYGLKIREITDMVERIRRKGKSTSVI